MRLLRALLIKKWVRWPLDQNLSIAINPGSCYRYNRCSKAISWFSWLIRNQDRGIACKVTYRFASNLFRVSMMAKCPAIVSLGEIIQPHCVGRSMLNYPILANATQGGKARLRASLFHSFC
jgi:hypothetical protein